MNVAEAKHGDEVRRGRVLIAPGGKHMQIIRADGQARVVLNEDPQENYHRPSIDVLFRSGAKHFGKHAVGVLLTGMGTDGARGMLDIRKAGGATIAQNEETCVIYGMPAEAVRLGAAEAVLPLREIAGGIVGAIRRMSPEPVSA
jgi:two-component system chemotaxis response regulator CheB